MRELRLKGEKQTYLSFSTMGGPAPQPSGVSSEEVMAMEELILLYEPPLSLPRVSQGGGCFSRPPPTHQADISQPNLEVTGTSMDGAESEEIGDGGLAGVSPGDLIILPLGLSLCSYPLPARDFLSRGLTSLNWWGLPASDPQAHGSLDQNKS